MLNTAILEASGLEKRYGERSVLRGVNLSVRKGERVALIGPSGSGKSTLLNCLGGIDRPDAGEVRVNGVRLTGLSGDELARLRLETIGTVFQFFHLLPTLTALENIEFPLQLLHRPRAERDARVAALVREVDLEHRADALPSELSGGEMQRVAIARALAVRPKVLLADEPTGNLDSLSGRAVLELLADLTRRHRSALLLVTHSPEAMAICDRSLHIRDGRLVETDD